MVYAAPPPADLPTTRTQGANPYQVIEIDYAGPVRYQSSRKRERKAYILLYACSLTRGIYIDLLPNLEISECLHSLKGFIARRGRPHRIYSDSGRTFVGAVTSGYEWHERMQNYLSVNQIHGQFNLSRAPWWGGQFERMIGLVKSALNKTIGHGMLSWKELQEVLSDVELTLNNRPLSYVEDDVQLPVLTPNSMLFANSNVLPEWDPSEIESNSVRKRAQHLLKCKEAMWGCWTKEYLRGLRERHRGKKGVGDSPKVGDVVIIKSEEKNRGKWPLGIVEELIVGNNEVVRGARLRAGKSHIERAVQHLYPLELSCDRSTPAAPRPLNPEAETYRPRRDAAIAAEQRIQDIA